MTVRENLKVLALIPITLGMCCVLAAIVAGALEIGVALTEHQHWSWGRFVNLFEILAALCGLVAVYFVVQQAAETPTSWLGKAGSFLFQLCIFILVIIGFFLAVMAIIDLYHKSTLVFLCIVGLVAYVACFYFNKPEVKAKVARIELTDYEP